MKMLNKLLEAGRGFRMNPCSRPEWTLIHVPVQQWIHF